MAVGLWVVARHYWSSPCSVQPSAMGVVMGKWVAPGRRTVIRLRVTSRGGLSLSLMSLQRRWMYSRVNLLLAMVWTARVIVLAMDDTAFRGGAPCAHTSAHYISENVFLGTCHGCLQTAQCNNWVGVQGWRSVRTYPCTLHFRKCGFGYLPWVSSNCTMQQMGGEFYFQCSKKGGRGAGLDSFPNSDIRNGFSTLKISSPLSFMRNRPALCLV